jgi:hypothetical protein
MWGDKVDTWVNRVPGPSHWGERYGDVGVRAGVYYRGGQIWAEEEVGVGACGPQGA